MVKHLPKIFMSLLVLCAVVSIVNVSFAFRAKTDADKNALEKFQFRADELYVSQSTIPIDQLMTQLPNKSEWENFLKGSSGIYVHIDPRSGKPASLITAIPFIPGTGDHNNVTLSSISLKLGRPVYEIGQAEVKELIMRFISDHANILGVNAKEIKEIRVSHTTDYLWHIFITRQINDIPVRDANISFVINHGNIILWGVEKWGEINVGLEPSVTKDSALLVGFSMAGGQTKRDKLLSEPHLELIPVSPVSYTGALGKGYNYYLAWVYTFQREGFVNTWEVIVNAHDSKVVSFQDMNLYAVKKITGTTYPVTDDMCGADGNSVYNTPMGYAPTGFSAPNDYTDLGGNFNYTTGTTTTNLHGKYAYMQPDNCGSINETGAGSIDLAGTNGDHDCTIPTGHSAGDTASTRSAAAEVTAINRTARGWLNYAWLDSYITVQVNLNSTCNAYFTGNSINFYRSGGGCRNTGEIAAVFDHEWGHGVDYNDPAGASNPGEVIADILSTLRLHNSCVGRGFWWTYNPGSSVWTCPTNSSSTGYLCGGYGDPCTNASGCTGIRDSDYAHHTTGTAHTPVNYICVRCSGGGGPCAKEVHCENAPAAEAAWDLAARDLEAAPFNYTKQTSFEVASRDIYIGSGNVVGWYTCNCSNNTSGGCAATNGYMTVLAADDDDGNTSNGTPHMTAIYAAYNRHGIACAAPTPQNSGCAGAPTVAPVLTATTNSTGAVLNWNAVTGATQYYVFRTEGPMGCDFGKIKIATVTGITYTDPMVDCTTNNYSVQPVGSNPTCMGPMSNCATVSAGSLPAPTGVTATASAPNQVTVNWNAVTGATGYNVYRRNTQCSTQVINVVASGITTTTYVDSPVSGGVTYDYSVTAIAALPQCESVNSNWASVTPTGDCALSPCFTGITSATNNKTATCGITLAWGTGTSSCAAYPTIKYDVYRSTDPAFVPGPANLLVSCLTGTTYLDSTPIYGNVYYYVVRAEDNRTGGAGPCNGGDVDLNVVKKNTGASGPDTTLFSDNFEVSMGNWTVSSRWTWATLYSHSTTHSAWSQDNTYQTCTIMTKTSMVALPAGSGPSLSFWTAYNTESGYDGGIVEGSSNGTTFTKLTLTPAYPGATNGSVTCFGAAQPAFSGNGAFTWAQYTSDLSAYAGGSFKMRFNYETDLSVNYGGWYVDDVVISYGSSCTNPTSNPPGKLLNTLMVTKTSGNPVLCWSPVTGTCTVTGYEVYRGNLPWTAYNHASLSCSATSCYTDSAAPNSYYYLVVPYNASNEGSYGTQFPAGTERPQGSSPCRTQNLTVCN